ncbi:ribbon-helix-helix protein, CopG family [Eggerthellaceae bacterium zg-997]|nr:ribbon-helix-helix protein, CopG family [Eggerthellaceae bacterium zg-997]
MSRSYTSATGQEITDEMIERWCNAYEKGEFPPGERSVGPVIRGRPPLSHEETVVLSIKVPASMKKALEREASSQGQTASAFARDAINARLSSAN